MSRSRARPTRRGGSRGTVLLLVIMIMVALTVLAAGFVRLMSGQRANGRDESRYLLAREAAIIGRNHAIEQIVRGYVQEPITRLDGPAIAPFQSLTNTWALSDTNIAPSRLDVDDRSAADPNFNALTATWGSSGYTSYPQIVSNGWWIGDGRGRYYEPEFYNLVPALLSSGTQFDILPALTAPTVPVRFGDTILAAPTRDAPLLLDEHFCRLAGPALSARPLARYRLRYAVDVVDLDGQLLLNPDPAIQPDRITDTDPGNLDPLAALALPPGEAVLSPDNPDMVAQIYPRIIRAGHAWYNMQFIWSGMSALVPDACAQGALGRCEHVLLGRGFSNNFDQRLPYNQLAAVANYAPVSWSLMYRGAGDPNFFKEDDLTDGSGLTTSLAQGLYADSSAMATKAGGGVISPSTLNSDQLLAKHVLTGPQYSFRNGDNAVNSEGLGGASDLGLKMFSGITPFGRGLLLKTASQYKQVQQPSYNHGYERYFGDVDTPWCVNPLTATPKAIAAMIMGILPTGVIQDEVYYYVSPVANPPVVIDEVPTAIRGIRDLFLPQMSPAFANYLPPTRQLTDGTTIAPDFHLYDDLPGDNTTMPDGEVRMGYRTPGQRYPGPVAFNGFTPNVTMASVAAGSALVHDNLGYFLRMKYVNTNGQQQYFRLPAPNDPNTGLPFWFEPVFGSTSATPTFDAIPPLVTTSPWGSIIRPNPASIWTAMGEAMSAAIAVARAQWLQFPNANANPSELFSIQPDMTTPTFGPWPAGMTKIRTLLDLDTQFLANLGIDIENPTNPPVPVWGVGPLDQLGHQGFYSYTPLHNVASLANASFFTGNDPMNPDPSQPSIPYDPSQPTYTSSQRAAVMELMINDFRLSFFGASPGYVGGFKPLDLDGDGKIHCSCYPSNPGATSTEQQLHLDQYVTGPVPVQNAFSLTGCFWLGKSRFYRIITRGEVWDSFTNSPASQCLLDSVLCVDPANEAQELDPPSLQNPGRQYSTHIIYQRTWSDKYRGDLSRNY